MGSTSFFADYRLYITSARSLQASCGPKIFFALPKKTLDKREFQAYTPWQDETVDADE